MRHEAKRVGSHARCRRARDAINENWGDKMGARVGTGEQADVGRFDRLARTRDSKCGVSRWSTACNMEYH